MKRFGNRGGNIKKDFFDYMLTLMRQNKDIYFIMCGLGWPRIEEFLQEFPERSFNFEASEQTGLDACVGLAYAGKIPVVYTITPFLYRGFETIRTYINHEKLHVILIGAGRDDEYSKHDGYSHYAGDDMDILGIQKNIALLWPRRDQLRYQLEKAITHPQPWYINISR